MKTIYTALLDRLNTISTIKYVDLDTGQLDTPDRPGIAFPGILISIDIPQCSNITDTIQSCTAKISLRVAFNPSTVRTSSVTPNNVRENSLKLYDVLSEIYSVLQGWETDQFGPLSRTSMQKESRSDGLLIYKLEFECVFEDESSLS